MLPESTFPTLDEVLDGAQAVSIPLTTSFRGITVRQALLVHGPSGWGEFSPFDDYDALASSRWLLAAIEAAWGAWPVPIRQTVAV
ncbi:MAG TPA: O-succinylbenzoate synthase, partial [Actinomycetes bacterium]|nr:O-succinylbenzoate synthase [Actinomycetes bacterium]